MNQERAWDRWFRRRAWEFCPLLKPFIGHPITYLEIGCWAGASAEWVAQNVLTHPGSQGHGIDPYFEDLPRHPKMEIDQIMERARTRLKATGANWTWHRRPSTEVLREIKNPIHILYVDGDHDGHAVVQDFALAWPHLAVGGLVIFDDYVIKRRRLQPNVREGVKAIVHAWGRLLEPVGMASHQRAFRIAKKRHESPVTTGWWPKAS